MTKESVVCANTSDEIEHTGFANNPFASQENLSEEQETIAVVWIHGLYQNDFDKPGILIGRE